jgi:hypothetical protein
LRLPVLLRLTAPELRHLSKSPVGILPLGRAAPIFGREGTDGQARIFLGSSGKQEKLLQALTRGLEDVAHVEPWTTSFNPGTTTLERLLALTHEVDFAALNTATTGFCSPV